MSDHPIGSALQKIESYQVSDPILVWKRLLLVVSCILLINRVDVRQYCCGCFLHPAAVVVVFVSMLWKLANRKNFSALLCGAILLGSFCTRLPYLMFFAWRFPYLASMVDADSESVARGRRFDYGGEIVVSYGLMNEAIYVVYEKVSPGKDGSDPDIAVTSGFWGGRHARKNAIHIGGPWLMLVD